MAARSTVTGTPSSPSSPSTSRRERRCGEEPCGRGQRRLLLQEHDPRDERERGGGHLESTPRRAAG